MKKIILLTVASLGALSGIAVHTAVSNSGASHKVAATADSPRQNALRQASSIRSASGLLAPAAKSRARAAEAPVTVPYSCDFSTDDLSPFTIIDADNDGYTWSYDRDRHCMRSFSTKSGLIDKDDWFFFPGFILEKGKIYTVNVDLWRRFEWNTERAAVFMGSAPTVEAMTRTLLPVTELDQFEDLNSSGDWKPERPYTFDISVEEDGTYYIGVHACSEPMMSSVMLDDFSIECTSSAEAPGQVTDFQAKANIHGELRTELTLTAPAVTNSGSPLTSLSRVDILRDGTLIKRFESPSPGAALQYTDDTPRHGARVYTAIAASGDLEGLPVTVEEFVGFSNPKAPAHAYIREKEGELGTVIVSWDAVTEDVNGKIYPEGMVTYTIADAGYYLENNYTGLSYEHRAVEEGQDLVYYGIFANAGIYGRSSEYANTGFFAAGEPYEIPFYESAPAADMSYIWGMKNWSEGSTWGTLDLESSGGTVDAFDGDGGYFASMCENPGDSTMLVGCKIDISRAENPYLRFAYYSWGVNPRPETIRMKFRRAGDPEYSDVAVFKTGDENPEAGWRRVFVPLSQFRGQVIQPAIETVMDNHFYTLFDAYTVYNVLNHDLAVTGMKAPSLVRSGESHNVTARIENMGVNTEADYTVDLLFNGEKVQSLPGKSIALGETADFEFTNVIGVNIPEENAYSVRVSLPSDENLADNVCEESPIAVSLPNYPVPTDLEGVVSQDNKQVNLTWLAPDTSRPMPEATIDGFEDYSSFAIDSFGDWLSLDLDGEVNYTIEDNEFPHNGEAIGFMVLDTRRMQTPYEAHNGSKAAVSFPSTKNENNDWLISPELWDGGQEISFFAKSHIGLYGLEAFKVYVSTTGNSLGDFSIIGEVNEVPTTWTRYSYVLPEGAKYFAIACVSKNMLCFMVDDVEMLLASSPLPDLTLSGYNIYRDMKRLNDTPVAATSFTDESPVGGVQHSYAVSAVYAAGESRLSEAVSPFGSSVDDIAATADARVYGGTGLIHILGAAGQRVSIYTVAGTQVETVDGHDTMTLTAAPGIYLVRIGRHTFKTLVK